MGVFDQILQRLLYLRRVQPHGLIGAIAHHLERELRLQTSDQVWPLCVLQARHGQLGKAGIAADEFVQVAGSLLNGLQNLG